MLHPGLRDRTGSSWVFQSRLFLLPFAIGPSVPCSAPCALPVWHINGQSRTCSQVPECRPCPSGVKVSVELVAVGAKCKTCLARLAMFAQGKSNCYRKAPDV